MSEAEYRSASTGASTGGHFSNLLWYVLVATGGVLILGVLFALQSLASMAGLLVIGDASSLAVFVSWWIGCLVWGGYVSKRLN